MTRPADYVDHHCHGIVTGDLDRAAFEALFSEAHRPHIPGCSQFDKPLGLMIRRHCAPLLGLEPHADPDAYLERRQALGSDEANRLLMQGAGQDVLLIDTGHRSDDITGVDALGALAGCSALEVVRIEAVMEEAAGEAEGGADLLDRFEQSLTDRSRTAVGLKSIVAYRASFDIDQTPPTRGEAEASADAWLVEIGRTGRRRIADPVLLRHALFVGLDLATGDGLPIQLHVGFGDEDIIMHKCDPTVFTGFIKEAEKQDVAITLLHCYPFHREAAWLSEVFSNAYFDLGAILNYVGPSAPQVLGEAMEMGAFHKQLYSSDAFGLAELHHLGRVLFEDALKSVLDGWIARSDVTVADAERVASMIASGNARRIYPIDRKLEAVSAAETRQS